MLYFTLIPGKEVPRFLIQFDDLFLHWGMYFFNYSLFYLGLIAWKIKTPVPKSQRWWLLFISVGIGGVLELIQEYLVSGRDGSLSDMTANTIGSLFGLLLFSWWQRSQIKTELASK